MIQLGLTSHEKDTGQTVPQKFRSQSRFPRLEILSQVRYFVRGFTECYVL